jgi:dipeptidyl aminopeptidase/acylaminoacyl peptidase
MDDGEPRQEDDMKATRARWVALSAVILLAMAYSTATAAVWRKRCLPLVHRPPLTPTVRPTTAPGLRRIAFVSDRDGNYEVYLMHEDGTEQVNLTHNPACENYAAWSPNGSKLLFPSMRDGNSEIYVMNADGSSPRNLTQQPGSRNSYPAWKP